MLSKSIPWHHGCRFLVCGRCVKQPGQNTLCRQARSICACRATRGLPSHTVGWADFSPTSGLWSPAVRRLDVNEQGLRLKVTWLKLTQPHSDHKQAELRHLKTETTETLAVRSLPRARAGLSSFSRGNWKKSPSKIIDLSEKLLRDQAAV